MPPAFLMQQMEWREGLDDARAARNVETLEVLDGELRSLRKSAVGEIGALINAANYADAALVVRKLMFVEKFGEEVGRAFDLLAD
jgi:molecular chaperone HscB